MPARSNRKTRLQRLIALHVARGIGRRVALWEAQREGGAQHGARYREMRSLGYVVHNEMERQPDGSIHSYYTLLAMPVQTAPLFVSPKDRLVSDEVSRWELERMRRRG